VSQENTSSNSGDSEIRKVAFTNRTNVYNSLLNAVVDLDAVVDLLKICVERTVLPIFEAGQ